MEELIFKNNKGQKVGWLKEGIYRKEVSRKKHLMKLYNAWGIDAGIMEALKKEGCTEIRVKDKDTKAIYSVSYTDFMKNGVAAYFEGPQYFLPLQFWEIKRTVV